jgi:transcriptional regulator with XRE-family HTH domain
MLLSMMLSRDWLTELRRQKQTPELLQKDLAEMVGVSAAVVCQWEAGTRRPGYDKMCRLAEILGPEVHDHFAEEARAKQAGRVA